MEVCAVKDRANNGSNLATRFAPHHLVSEHQVAHGTAEEMAGASSSRRSYWRLSSDFMLEEEGYGADLFHTYCKVGDRSCATTIDHDSAINAVGVDMVEKLELSTTPHPRPYSLRRCHAKLDITHQTMVQFSIGKFSSEILCDVIPVPMISCYLLLGEPWYKENKVVYNFLANTYTVTRENIYILKAMEKKAFIAWRKDRLQKMKEQKEAKKKEDAAAATSVASVKSRDSVVPLETDLKPRTVSFEEGEDDTAGISVIRVSMVQFKTDDMFLRVADDGDDNHMRSYIHDRLDIHVSRWIRCLHVHMRINANHVFDPGGFACNEEVSSAWDTIQAKQEDKRRCYFYGICSARSKQFLAGTIVCFFWRSRPPEIDNKASTKELDASSGVCI